jgi:hypothetical protein
LAPDRRKGIEPEQLRHGAEPGQQKHRRPSTSVPTEARG